MPRVDVATYLADEMLPSFDVGPDVIEFSRPLVVWDDRFRTFVEVHPDLTFQELLKRAKTQLGLEMLPYYDSGEVHLLGHLYGADRDDPLSLGPMLDHQGAITLDYDPAKVTYGDLLAASDAGILEGDLGKVYLDLDQRQGFGGPGLIFWENFIRNLPETLIWVGGVYGGVRLFIDTAIGSQKVFSKLRNRWSARRIHLQDVRRAVNRPRTTKEVAQLLGVSTEEAKKVLQVLALHEEADGRWYPHMDVDAEIVRLAVDIAEQASEMGLDQQQLRQSLDRIAAMPDASRRASVSKAMEEIRDIASEDAAPDQQERSQQ